MGATTGCRPLAGLRVVELAGNGPGHRTSTLLADLGAEVVRVQCAGLISGAGPEPQFYPPFPADGGLDPATFPSRNDKEASSNHHAAQRGSPVELDGVTQRRPAPRASRSDPGLPSAPATEAVDAGTLWT